jgi:predicted nucleic acid-binding protein
VTLSGMDSNVLCNCLDPAYPEHERLKGILLDLGPGNRVAVNPTVVHESYHALVFGQKLVRSEARRRLLLVLRHPYVEFVNQTRRVSEAALKIAVDYGIGGRDALILASFLLNKIPVLLTRDRDLLSLTEVKWHDWKIAIVDPLAE